MSKSTPYIQINDYRSDFRESDPPIVRPLPIITGEPDIHGSSRYARHKDAIMSSTAGSSSSPVSPEYAPPPPYSFDPPDLPTDTTTARFVATHRDQPVAKPSPPPAVPRLNIVIFIVGSRGDVQPYLAFALFLIAKHGHRVRIATHPNFKDFVLNEKSRLRDEAGGFRSDDPVEDNLEFFNAGGDPKGLMEYMVKNPGLIPSFDSLRSGDVGKKQKMASEMLDGFYQSTFSPDPVTGKPFAADVIISNPPAFAHLHVVEALGIPLHMSFTMPWTASTAFPHPLMGPSRRKVDKSVANYLGFGLADNLMWQGLGPQINQFRKRKLLLGHLHQRIAPGLLDELKVPWSYCWSPDLLPKPEDWRRNIEISGFYFLDNELSFTPPRELADFLANGSTPVYIGFGSIPVPNPDKVTRMLVEASELAGVRIVLSAGWAGLGLNCEVPSHVFVVTFDVPHEWLFSHGRVAGVIHHGGAGTTATGLRYGRPTAIIPFFGDQKFWGDVVFGAGAGPAPVLFKRITLEQVVEAIRTLSNPSVIAAAESIGSSIRDEKGEAKGADSLHRHLPIDKMRCDLDDSRVAILYCQKYELRLSAPAAGVLLEAGLITEKDLVALRTLEHDTFRHNFDPVRALLYGTTNAFATGVTGMVQLTFQPLQGLRNLIWGLPRDVLSMFGDLHEGFDNLPHWMGATTRSRRRPTSIGSGFTEGGKSLCWGFYDGVVGLVADPLDGALREGAVGCGKGLIRGALNMAIRPTAGFLGFMCYPVEGTVRAARKAFAKAGDPREILLAPRLWAAKSAKVSDEARQSILARFDDLHQDVKKRRKQRHPTKWVLMKNAEERRLEQLERLPKSPGNSDVG